MNKSCLSNGENEKRLNQWFSLKMNPITIALQNKSQLGLIIFHGKMLSRLLLKQCTGG